MPNLRAQIWHLRFVSVKTLENNVNTHTYSEKNYFRIFFSTVWSFFLYLNWISKLSWTSTNRLSNFTQRGIFKVTTIPETVCTRIFFYFSLYVLILRQTNVIASDLFHMSMTAIERKNDYQLLDSSSTERIRSGASILFFRFTFVKCDLVPFFALFHKTENTPHQIKFI